MIIIFLFVILDIVMVRGLFVFRYKVFDIFWLIFIIGWDCRVGIKLMVDNVRISNILFRLSGIVACVLEEEVGSCSNCWIWLDKWVLVFIIKVIFEDEENWVDCIRVFV